MSWLVLLLSGLLETAWAAALAESRGLSRPIPSVVFVVALVLSMAGLAYSLKAIPIGTGYAVWVGIGVTGTAAYGMLVLAEPVSAARTFCLALILSGVVGLKLFH